MSDAQCGFKAGRREAIQALLPEVENDNWFFDSELIHLAEQGDLRSHEVPVDCELMAVVQKVGTKALTTGGTLYDLSDNAGALLAS